MRPKTWSENGVDNLSQNEQRHREGSQMGAISRQHNKKNRKGISKQERVQNGSACLMEPSLLEDDFRAGGRGI